MAPKPSLITTYFMLDEHFLQQPEDADSYEIPLSAIADLADACGVTLQLLHSSQRPTYFIFPRDEKEIGQKVDVEKMEVTGTFCATPIDALMNCFECARNHLRAGYDTAFLYDNNFVLKSKHTAESKGVLYYAQITLYPYKLPESRVNSPA